MMCGFRGCEVTERPGLCMCQRLQGKQENSYKKKKLKDVSFNCFPSLFGIITSFELRILA